MNERPGDRMVRIVLGFTLAILAVFWIGGTLQTIAYVLAVVLLVTGFSGFCGLYALLGWNQSAIPQHVQ